MYGIKLIAPLVAVSFLSVPAPAQASDASDDFAKALAGVVALGVLGAAAGKHQHQQGYNNYRAHPQLHPDENAVGACMHYSQRIVDRAGGYSFDLDRVQSIDLLGDGVTQVRMIGTGYYDNGSKTSRIVCNVRNSTVIGFNYN